MEAQWIHGLKILQLSKVYMKSIDENEIKDEGF